MSHNCKITLYIDKLPVKTRKGQSLDQKKSLNAIDNLLLTLWGIGIFSAIMIVFAMFRIGFHDAKEIAPLIGAFAILISAGLASASVMKSIYTARINDQEKAAKEKERKRIFALNVIKTIHVTLTAFLTKIPHHTFGIPSEPSQSKSDFDSDIQTTGKLIDLVFCESILPYLTEDEQNIISNFYSEYYRFLATYSQLEIKPSDSFKPTKKPTMNLRQYAQTFTSFAQSYIDLNTKNRR